ncbi:MAG TPA: protein-glutamate O-methyltransferase CheR [Desulfuromonadales bacterium]|nr:protein-glutamate O-methyltransferase CheR [Desulfuromonadales bacterium]
MTSSSPSTGSPTWTGDSLGDQELQALLALLAEKRQFRLDNYKDRCIRRRIAKRLRAAGVTDLQDYLVRLANDDDELDALLATLSIHVSRFFRNPDTFRIIEQRVLPELCRRAWEDGRTHLRFWSVGCAGGEEPYSLALLIDELRPQGLQVDILGTDVSPVILKAARQGLYRRERLTEVPAAILDQYFSAEGDAFRLEPRIRGMVRFERHNLMAAGPLPAADMILCRNVLIYFSRSEQARVLAQFSDVLPVGGVLVLGRSEALSGDIRRCFYPEFPVERIYRRQQRTTLS